VETASTRYPVATWIAGAIVTAALAAGVRVGAALTDVEVVFDPPGGEGAAPLELGALLLVTVAVFVLAVAMVLVLDQAWPDRSRGAVRAVLLVVVLASFAAVVLGDTPTDAAVVLGLLHLVVVVGTLRTVVRS
jgi:hypothetical protein